jgi:protein-disulfide isomerase
MKPYPRTRGGGLLSMYGLFVFLLGLAAALSCEVARAGAADPQAILADVDGERISAEEVDQALGAPLRQLEEQIYTMRRDRVEALIGERLLAREAAKRGLSVPALLDAEVTPKVGLVSEQEIAAVYESSKEGIKADKATAWGQIRAYLQNQKLAAQRETFVRALAAQSRVTVHLKPPPVVRVEVSAEGAPMRGLATAPVTIVEFTDFHCPYCKRVLPTLTQLLARYGDRVRLIFRDFPMDSLHPQARQAAEAARCAGEQEKFWEFHDVIFANAPRASPEQLKTYAEQTGLDVARFEACLASGAHRAAVQRDVEEGNRLGVTGTPAFFVNGRLLTGAQPLDRFARLIDDELARTR